MTIADNPFNIDHYLNLTKGKKNDQGQKLDDLQVATLQTKYAEQLKAKLSDPGVQQLYENKMVAQIFLDKITNTYGKWHREVSSVHSYGFSSSSVASMQMIRYLNEIKEDPRLSPETKQAINRWIATESDYLPIAVIMDGWRMQNKQLVEFVESKQKKVPKEGARAFKINPDPKEVQVLSNSIAQHIADMKQGETFKMLGGFNIHETRLFIRKEEDGQFSVYHYNTGAVTGEEEQKIGNFSVDLSSTLTKITKVSPEKLGDPKTWETFISLKLSEPNMQEMNKLMSSWGEKSEIYEDPKSKQGSDACPVQSCEADLKQFLIQSGSTPEEGLVQYKIVKSLISEKALQMEKGRVDPKLYAMMQEKEAAKHRYLFWWEIAKDPEKLSQVKNAYAEMIKSLDPQAEIKLKKAVEGKSPIIMLRTLDNMLHQLLLSSSAEKVTEVMQRHSALFKVDETPILCMKYAPHARKLAETVESICASTQTFPGNVLSRLRGWTGTIGSGKIKEMLEPYLRGGQISSKDLVEVLKEYIRTESGEKSRPVIQDLLDNSLIDLKDIETLFFSQVAFEHPALLNFLAVKTLEVPNLDRGKWHTCLAAADPPRLIKELEELAKKNPHWIVQEANVNFVVSLLYIGGRETEINKLLELFHTTMKSQTSDNFSQEFIGDMQAFGAMPMPAGTLINFFAEKVTPEDNPVYYRSWIRVIFHKKLNAQQQIRMLDAILAKEGQSGMERLQEGKIALQPQVLDHLFLERHVIDGNLYIKLLDVAVRNPNEWEKKVESLLQQGVIQPQNLYPLVMGRNYNRVLVADILLRFEGVSEQYKLICKMIVNKEGFIKDASILPLDNLDASSAKILVDQFNVEEVSQLGDATLHSELPHIHQAIIGRLVQIHQDSKNSLRDEDISIEEIEAFQKTMEESKQKAEDLFNIYAKEDATSNKSMAIIENLKADFKNDEIIPSLIDQMEQMHKKNDERSSLINPDDMV